MAKTILIIGNLLLVIGDGLIFFDLKKYIKKHENELIEDNIKGLIGRCIGMIIIALCIGICGIVIRIL